MQVFLITLLFVSVLLIEVKVVFPYLNKRFPDPRFPDPSKADEADLVDYPNKHERFISAWIGSPEGQKAMKE